MAHADAAATWGADTRSAKPFSRQAYDHGVVIVQCPGCSARHLLADRLGWFGEAGSIEDVLADKGESAPSASPILHFSMTVSACACGRDSDGPFVFTPSVMLSMHG